MPSEFLAQEVKSDGRVVGVVNTPVFGPASGDLAQRVAALTPQQAEIVLGFLDAGEWLQAKTESAGGGLPGTADGKVIDGLAYGLGLITTQNATNMKNRIRSAFNQPISQEKLKEQALGEFYKLAQTDVNKLQEIASRPGGPEAWVAARMKELEGEHEDRRKKMIAEAAAANAKSGGGGGDSNDASE